MAALETGYNTWKPISKIVRKDKYAKVFMRCDVCKTEKLHMDIMERIPCNCQKENNVVVSSNIVELLKDGNTCRPFDEPLEHCAQTWIITCSCGHENWRTKFTPKDTKCSSCKSHLFKQTRKIKDRSELIGGKVGIYTIIGFEKGGYLLSCESGTVKKYKSLSAPSANKTCPCKKCNPNRGWTSKKLFSAWNKIKDTEGLYWGNYYEFEKWVDTNLPYNKDKPCLNRLDKQKPYAPDNVWWSIMENELHVSYWIKELNGKLPDNISLVSSSGKNFKFSCSKGHEFYRHKGTTLDGIRNKGGRVITCLECKAELAKERAAVPKQVRLTIQEQITRDTPSLTLVSDNNSWDDSVGHFECSECNTGFSMSMKVFASKQVCPICKSEKRGRFCDSEIERKFGGKIIRTGVWRRCDVPTTWKCLKHGTHFKKTYDKVKASQSGGCPDCIEFSVPDPDAPTTLYYVRLKYDNTHFYKIGITQRTVYTRFDGEIAKKNLHIVKEWVYTTWREAYDAEQKVINAYRGELLCRGERPLRKTESTEIFYHDVLELDHAHKNH